MKTHHIGLGVLSWKAHETLKATLNSYRDSGLLELFEDKVIHFNDISDEDRAIAEDYGFRAVGGENKGIATGTENLVKAIESEHVLVVQNDNPLVESVEFADAHLGAALSLLENNKADLVRMRHRWQVGEGFADVVKYLKVHGLQECHPDFSALETLPPEVPLEDGFGKKLQRLLRPGRAHQMKGRGIFIEASPETLFPDVIRRDGDFLLVDSAVINFSDQCFMCAKRFYLDVLAAYVNANPSSRTLNNFQVPEICLNSPWWRKQHFQIAQGRGIFTHGRLDGSFRANHHAYDASMGD